MGKDCKGVYGSGVLGADGGRWGQMGDGIDRL